MSHISKPKRIAILAQEPSPTVLENIVPAAQARGIQVDVLKITGIPSLCVQDPQLEVLRTADLAYYRTAGFAPVLGPILCAKIREWGIPSVNCIHDLTPHINRKSYQMYIGARAGICIPRTVADTGATYDGIVESLGSPFVAKLDDSARGRDVHLIATQEEFNALAGADKFNKFLFQEYVAHAWDYRVHIVDDKAVAMYKRVPKEGDFRANVSRGGRMEPVEESRRAELASMAESLAPHFGFAICAIDFLCSSRDGSLVFAEVNDNPGWESSDALATGVDLTAITLDFFERKLSSSGC